LHMREQTQVTTAKAVAAAESVSKQQTSKMTLACTAFSSSFLAESLMPCLPYIHSLIFCSSFWRGKMCVSLYWTNNNENERVEENQTNFLIIIICFMVNGFQRERER